MQASDPDILTVATNVNPLANGIHYRSPYLRVYNKPNNLQRNQDGFFGYPPPDHWAPKKRVFKHANVSSMQGQANALCPNRAPTRSEGYPMKIGNQHAGKMTASHLAQMDSGLANPSQRGALQSWVTAKPWHKAYPSPRLIQHSSLRHINGKTGISATSGQAALHEPPVPFGGHHPPPVEARHANQGKLQSVSFKKGSDDHITLLYEPSMMSVDSQESSQGFVKLQRASKGQLPRFNGDNGYGDAAALRCELPVSSDGQHTPQDSPMLQRASEGQLPRSSGSNRYGNVAALRYEPPTPFNGQESPQDFAGVRRTIQGQVPRLNRYTASNNAAALRYEPPMPIGGQQSSQDFAGVWRSSQGQGPRLNVNNKSGNYAALHYEPPMPIGGQQSSQDFAGVRCSSQGQGPRLNLNNGSGNQAALRQPPTPFDSHRQPADWFRSASHSQASRPSHNGSTSQITMHKSPMPLDSQQSSQDIAGVRRASHGHVPHLNLSGTASQVPRLNLGAARYTPSNGSTTVQSSFE